MLAQVIPSAPQCEHAKPGFLQIAFHVRRENAVPFARVKLPLNRISVVTARRNSRTVRAPVLQQHRNRCRPATFGRLLDERNVEPNPRFAGFLGLQGKGRDLAQQQKARSEPPPPAVSIQARHSRSKGRAVVAPFRTCEALVAPAFPEPRRASCRLVDSAKKRLRRPSMRSSRFRFLIANL